MTLSTSSFVPKPFTPFQWCAMARPEDLRAKQDLLKTRAPAARRRTAGTTWRPAWWRAPSPSVTGGWRRCSSGPPSSGALSTGGPSTSTRAYGGGPSPSAASPWTTTCSASAGRTSASRGTWWTSASPRPSSGASGRRRWRQRPPPSAASTTATAAASSPNSASRESSNVRPCPSRLAAGDRATKAVQPDEVPAALPQGGPGAVRGAPRPRGHPRARLPPRRASSWPTPTGTTPCPRWNSPRRCPWEWRAARSGWSFRPRRSTARALCRG